MDALESHLRKQVVRGQRFFWHRLRWHAVRRHLPSAQSFELLDVGAGAGLLGEFLARDLPRARYRFIEPIPSLERYLTDRYGAAANASKRRDHTETDVVALLDVLEHQDDDRAFLGDLVSRMRPKATLVLTVPAMPILWSGWDVALGHHRRYTLPGLRSLLARYPIRIREISYLFPEMILPALVRKLMRGTANGGLDAESTAFPDLPVWLDETLYAMGLGLQAMRRSLPFGTSLFVSATRELGDRVSR